MANSSEPDVLTPDAAPLETPPLGPQNPLEALLGYQLRRASAAMLADFAETLADIGLRPTEVSIVLVVEANPGIIQSEVGRMLSIQRANMAPLAAGLTDSGWIVRSRSDGRSQGLRLSAFGLERAATIRSRIQTHETRFAGDLSPLERAKLIKLLHSLWAGDAES